MSTKANNEIEIWAGVINPDQSDMPEPSAMAVLGWTFNDEAKQRMEMLATRNGQDTLSDSEREELEAYVNVGQVIAILQAKARLSLKRAGGN
jgi:hypothetical protein